LHLPQQLVQVLAVLRHAENTMSYRHRVGVLLSVLWLIGLPICVLVNTNQRASKTFGSCMSVVKNINWCLPGAGFVSTREIAHNLVAGDRNTVVLWSLMVGPIIIFWLIRRIAFTTVRSIRRELQKV
jgi:hypothetical protein